MGRYLGPKHKICRRVGMKICSNAKCPVTRRSYPAGMHGQNKRQKVSEYSTQLLEKQKAKHIYGVLERQFKRYYTKATAKPGDTSVYLAQELERRLDNLIYRFGAATTRRQARQMVGHGHIQVNGKKVNIPSYQVCPGDEIGFPTAKDDMERREPQSWFTVDAAAQKGTITGTPNASELPEKLNTRLIIEFYSR